MFVETYIDALVVVVVVVVVVETMKRLIRLSTVRDSGRHCALI